MPPQDWTIHIGDAWKLSCQRFGIIQAIVTSPPYWRQRLYGTNANEFGNETTARAYIDRLVSLFSELKWSMSETGTMWLNIGDTIKDKRQQGIPTRVALALEERAGWFWRSEVIFERENQTPRQSAGCPLQSHEHVLLFSAGEIWYYDDSYMRERSKYAGYHYKRPHARKSDHGRLRMDKEHIVGETRMIRSVWKFPTGWHKVDHPALMPRMLAERCVLSITQPHDIVLDPFAGAGTTGVIALEQGRKFVGFELYESNAEIMQRRLAAVQPSLLYMSSEGK